MADTIRTVDTYGLGVALITTPDHVLTGIITDGDIRHFIASNNNILEYRNVDVMTKNPRSIRKESPVYDALNMMERHQITVLPIVDALGKIVGVLHLHDILGKGAFKFNGS